MPTVFIAGSTGYLGRHLCREYQKRGWSVRALVRDSARARHTGLVADAFVEAEATCPETLTGIMSGCDLVISSLGITRQRDGLRYQDVDFQANINLLQEAIASGVKRFGYIHVLNGDKMTNVALVSAKQAFVDCLVSSPIESTVIAPSGYFSDMSDFLTMARAGRVWLFGKGSHQINPIDGEDLAAATAQTIASEKDWLDVGGPDIFTHTELASLAFDALGKPAKISYLPDAIRRCALWVLPKITPLSFHGPIQFFLCAMGMHMVGEQHGCKSLLDHFKQQRNA
ncbi:SDR family oxidoreductase [Cohaesibacter celericrescens]|uniref:NAD(P)-dependent oxidoreductase n=2 Tax=Cohaesibacter celericrescens TaxID=2067669 RepID=A0A2N5XTR1_9HYPH|nr:SDR family oxidoreductase [Cohaesibacter celericrescens]PLW77902.1 NAD(P)-dependent oxidoreductase [Cohaesibacter celericrescens]